jgi:hypothetical protein
MPDAAVNRSAQTTTKAVAKPTPPSADPAIQPTSRESAIMANRLGPRFAIRVAWEAPIDPTIAPTQANGRILPPAHPYGSIPEFADGSRLGKDL